MTKCPICGKELKNPNAPSHINSKYHQEFLTKQEDDLSKKVPEKVKTSIKKPKAKIKEKIEHKRAITKEISNLSELRENLIDDEGYIKFSELEALASSNMSESDLIEFLNIEQYKFRFEDLDEFFSIINLLMNFFSLESVINKFKHFNQEILKRELKNKIEKIEIEYFKSTTYGFDLVIKLISQYLGWQSLIELLLDFEDLEDILSKSYFEETNADSNPTFMIIEHALSDALNGDSQELYNDAVYVINNSGIFFEHLRKKLLNTFRVNKYIKLKLVGNRTNIYVNDRLFNQCKYLLLNIPTDRIRDYRDVESIDEAAEKLDRSMEGRGGRYVGIPPETEFWGHCSNIQAWVENDYDTRLLHRNLAFPLLKRLTEVGDPIARRVFTQEVTKRIGSGYSTVIEYLFVGGYLQYLRGTDLDKILDTILKGEYWNYTPEDYWDIHEEFLDELFLERLAPTYRPIYTSKREVLRRFADLGSQKANLLLSDMMLEDLKTANITTIKKILSQNYFRYIEDSNINDIFDQIKDNILKSQNIDSKLEVLKKFADIGVIKARTPLRKTVKEKARNASLQALLNMFSQGFFNYIGKQELGELFKNLNLQEKEWNFHKLQILRNFEGLKLAGVKPSLKKGVKKLLKSKDMKTAEQIITHNYLNYFNAQEINEIFNLMVPNITSETENKSVLTIFKKFADLKVKEAETLFKQNIKLRVKSANIHNIETLFYQDYLKYFKENELDDVFKQVNYKGLFNQDVSRSIRLLEKLEKKGLKDAKSILKNQTREILKQPERHTIGPVLNKSCLNLFTEDELNTIINEEGSKLIESSFEIALSKIRSNLRTKIIRFLKDVKAISEGKISKKIINTLRRAELDAFCTFMRAKLLTLLSIEEKEELLEDPKCLLRQFIVKYEGREFQVDYNLGLNLSGKNIQVLSKVEGLSNLTQLKTLDLRENMLPKIVGIGNLTNLKKLRIRGNRIPEELIEHLGGIDRYGNAIKPQKFVEYSRRVESGEITHVKVGDKKFEIFTDELILRNMGIKKISEIKGFSELSNLRKIDLSNNQLEDLEGLEHLTSLKVLNLSRNEIKDTTCLEKLVSLEELRLYGNEIHELRERDSLKNLKILDLDTKRQVNDRQYLNYLLQSLNMDQIKQICRDFYIRGYSRYNRDPLISFTLNSLSEEEWRLVISRLETEVISRELDLALKKINYKDREFVQSIHIVNKANNEVEIKFKGYNWETNSYLSITPDTISNPERDCDCRIGSNNGFCSHFWVGFIFSLKEGYFKLSDWTMTQLPYQFEEKLDSIKAITIKSDEKRLVDTTTTNSFLIENIDSRVIVHDAELTQFERRQYTWQNKMITYYLNTIKSVKVSLETQKDDIRNLDNLLVRFSENMYDKFKLNMSKKVKLSGEVHHDSYLGLMLKNVFVLSADKQRKLVIVKKDEKKKISDADVSQEVVGSIKLNLNEVIDDLSGNWWHHLSNANFKFVETIPVVEGYSVNVNDILIHKEILPGDRYPSTRYHIVSSRGARLVKNYDVKKVLIKSLIDHVKETNNMPQGCRIAREFQNGNIQIDYTPSRNVKFALKITSNTYGVANLHSFFRSARIIESTTEEQYEPRPVIEDTSIKQWAVDSYSDPSKKYQVTLYPNGSWSCTCPHHVFRRAECKHIRQIKLNHF